MGPMPSRKPIEEGDVAMRRVPTDATNETAFSRIDDVLGRVSGVSISTGQLVSRNLLASTTERQSFSIVDPGEDERTATTAGSTLDSLIKEFGFPVPRPFAIK